MGVSLLYFLKQHLIAFVDKVYWCSLEKRTLHSAIFSVVFSSHVGCPPSGTKSGKTWRSAGYLILIY